MCIMYFSLVIFTLFWKKKPDNYISFNYIIYLNKQIFNSASDSFHLVAAAKLIQYQLP